MCLQLTDERDVLRRGRHVLSDEQHEDREREQHGDPERDLLARVGRQPEAEQGEDCEPETGEDDVEEVVERATSHVHVEGDVRVGFRAACVEDLVANHFDLEKLPLAAVHVVVEVDLGRAVGDVNLVSVVRPRAELHAASLVVEGEVRDVDATGRVEHTARFPVHEPRVVDEGAELAVVTIDLVCSATLEQKLCKVLFISGKMCYG